MKKWFSIFLIALTFAGTFFSCCLVDDCSTDPCFTTAQQDKDHDHEETCSPFFACAGCAFAIDLHKPVIELEPFQEQPLFHQALYLAELSTYTSSFFQPPRQA